MFNHVRECKGHGNARAELILLETCYVNCWEAFGCSTIHQSSDYQTTKMASHWYVYIFFWYGNPCSSSLIYLLDRWHPHTLDVEKQMSSRKYLETSIFLEATCVVWGVLVEGPSETFEPMIQWYVLMKSRQVTLTYGPTLNRLVQLIFICKNWPAMIVSYLWLLALLANWAINMAKLYETIMRSI